MGYKNLARRCWRGFSVCWYIKVYPQRGGESFFWLGGGYLWKILYICGVCNDSAYEVVVCTIDGCVAGRL